MQDINEVMKVYTPELLSIRGVVGLYVGAQEDGTPCIKIMVAKRSKRLEKKIPIELDGYPLVIHETGIIRAL